MPCGEMTEKNMLFLRERLDMLSILAIDNGLETPWQSPELLDLKLQ